MDELAQLRMRQPRRAAADRQHKLDSRVGERLAERALPDHAGRSEDDHFHGAGESIPPRPNSRPRRLEPVSTSTPPGNATLERGCQIVGRVPPSITYSLP